MANEGPTTVATIKGDLTLPLDKWEASVARVKESAREIGALNPDIRVDANTTQAEASLAAVDAAAEAVGATSERTGRRMKTSAAETSALAVAYAKFDAAINALSAAQAEENEQMRQGSIQALKESINMEALSAAERKAAEDALKQAAAQESEAAAINKTNTAQNGHIQRWQMILGLIVTLIPLMAPLAGYIVGVGGALAGMGAAGVLAIVGVVQAMKQGTAMGQQYSAGLQALKGDLNTLGGTAAVHLLSSFNDSVRLINGAMPELNREIGGFADQLGGSALSVLKGVITAFQVLNPLFVLGGQYVQQLADGFERWASDGGLQKFANDAIKSLPQVADVLGNLLTLILHIIDATAPIGTVMLAAINAVAGALNGIPVDVLTALATGAITVLVAYKGWSGISGIVNGVSTSLRGMAGAEAAAGASASAAAGPIGIIVGLMAAVAVGGVQAGNAVRSGLNDAFGNTRTVEQYSASLQNGTMNLDHLGRILQGSTGWLNDWTNTLSLGTSGTSQFYVEAAKIDQAMSSMAPKQMAASYREAVAQGKALGLSQQDVANRLPLTAAAMNAQKTASDQTTTSLQSQKTAAGMLTTAQANVAWALGLSATKYRELTSEQKAATTATDQLKQALDLLNGKQLSAAEAQNQFDSGIANMSQHLNAAGNMIDRANTLLTGNTAAAVANRGELISLTQAAESNAQAFRDNGGSADDTRKKLIDMKKEIVDNAVAHGEDRAQVQKFIDTIYQIPASIPPTKLEVENAAAMKAIAAAKAAIASIPRNVTVDINGATHINTASIPAAGLKAYAGGGTIAGVGSRTADRVVASLSATEEVVSNDRGQADKWRPTLKLINQDAPAGQIAGRASQIAGTPSSTTVMQPVQKIYHIYIPQQPDPVATSHSVTNRLTTLGV